MLGVAVSLCSLAAFLVRFSPAEETVARQELLAALARRRADDREAGRSPGGMALPDFANVSPMDAFRVFIGGALALKGVYFIVDLEAFQGLVGDLGHFDTVLSWYVVTAHAVGGMCIALGFVTRWAIAANLPVMIGAAVLGYEGASFFSGDQGLQLSVFVFASLMLLFWHGSGRFSMDALLRDE